MVTFSIIIPVYNASDTIERCVNSIISNQKKEIEIILIDDCSKDNSWEICQEIGKKYNYVKVLHNEENHGVSYTRNLGLDNATGEYIFFVDSDDWIDRDYIRDFQKVIEKYKPEFVICGYINHDEKMNSSIDEYGWDDFRDDRYCDLKQEAHNLYKKNILQQLWNKVFVRDIIEKNHIRFDENISIGEDFRFILNYIQMGKITNAILMNYPLYHYMRDQKGSLMYQIGYESVEEPLKNLKLLYEYMEMPPDKIQIKLNDDRSKQIELYAYLIMHNAGMKYKEKRRLILALDSNSGQTLYKKNIALYYKERIKIQFDKIFGKKGN